MEHSMRLRYEFELEEDAQMRQNAHLTDIGVLKAKTQAMEQSQIEASQLKSDYDRKRADDRRVFIEELQASEAKQLTRSELDQALASEREREDLSTCS